MGSKHIPPRWWAQGRYDEECDAFDGVVHERYLYDAPLEIESVPIPADKPVGLEWRTWQYVGFEVLDPDTRLPIPASTELPVGCTVLCYSLPAGRYVKAQVTSATRAECATSLFQLERDRDNRHAWTCGSEINKSAINRIELTLEV